MLFLIAGTLFFLFAGPLAKRAEQVENRLRGKGKLKSLDSSSPTLRLPAKKRIQIAGGAAFLFGLLDLLTDFTPFE